MAGGGAGGFVTRAFESMLKECANKKYAALQSAIQTYIDDGKDSGQQSSIDETNVAQSAPSDKSSSEPVAGVEEARIRIDPSITTPSVEESEPVGRSARTRLSIRILLANAGYTLSGAEAELVLNPIRLAFETKNIKVVELALDCLHDRAGDEERRQSRDDGGKLIVYQRRRGRDQVHGKKVAE